MRLRPVALLAAIPLALSGLAVIAPAASAAPPTYTTIDENSGAAHSTLDEPANSAWYSPDGFISQFTAEKTGTLTSVGLRTIAARTYTIGVYDLDQISLWNAAEGHVEIGPGVYAGESIGTTSMTTPADPANHYASFTDAGTLTAGTTYWVFLYGNGPTQWEAYAGASNAYYFHTVLDRVYGSSADAPKVDLNVGNPISVSLDPATPDGENGWYTTAPTATYDCIEAVVECPEPVTFETDGEFDPQEFVTLAEDGDFYWTHSVDVDTTAPEITGTASEVTTEAPHEGKTSGHLVSWDCTDATSGVATCPAPTYVTGLNSDTVAEAEATDNAGNTAVGTVENLVTEVPAVIAPPKAETKPEPKAKKKKAKKMTLVIKGLPTASKAGAPAFMPGKTTKLTIKIRGKNGKLLKGKPTWLHTVKTTKSGKKGKPNRELDLRKTKNGWVMDYTASWNWSGTFRKFAIIAPNGKRFTQVIYIR